MEKYRHCDESISKLLEWIADIEEQLANQDLLKETIEELKNQINDVKVQKIKLN
jgi:dystonin